MDVEIIQNFVAKLYTSRDFLTLFKESPVATFDLMEVSGKEKTFLESIDMKKLDKINTIIFDKQLSMIKNCYPVFSTHYKDEFEHCSKLFLRLNKNYVWSDEGTVRLCTDFYDFYFQKMFNRNTTKDWLLKDLIKFEFLRFTLGCQQVPKLYALLDPYFETSIKSDTRIFVHEYAHLEDFDFPVIEIIQKLKKSSSEVNLERPEKNHVLFIPSPLLGCIVLPVDPRHRKLLLYFNGKEPFETLGSKIKQNESQDVFDQLPKALAFFKSNKVLALI